MNRVTVIWLLAVIVAQASSSTLRAKKSLTVAEALAIAEKDGFQPMQQQPMQAAVPPIYIPQQPGMVPPIYPGVMPAMGYPQAQYRQMIPGGQVNFAEEEPGAAPAEPAPTGAAQAVSAAAAAGGGAVGGAMQSIMDLAKAQENQHSSLMTQVQTYINSEKQLANQLASEIRQKASALSKLIINLQGEGGQIKRTANTLAEKKEMEAQLKRQISRIQEQIQKLEGEVNTDNSEANKDKQSEGQTKGELGSEGNNYEKMLQTKKQYENDILTLRSEYRKVQDRYKALTTIPIAEIKVDQFAMGSPAEDPGLNFKDANGYYQDGLKDSNTHPPDISHPPPESESSTDSGDGDGGGGAPGAAELDELPPQGAIRPGEK